MEQEHRPLESAPSAQPPLAKAKGKVSGVVVAHRILSTVAICFGIMWILIGLSLMQTGPPSSSPSFSSGPGSQRQTYYHSSERDKAPAYIAFGVILAAVFAIGFFLKAGPAAYVYHTLLVILLIGFFGAGLILCIWWFRKRNRTYYGLGATG